MSRCGGHRVDQAGILIHSNLHLHAKEPLVPFTGLVHLWIPFPLFILSGGGGMDDGGIHYCPLPQQQALLSQILPHCLEDLLGQLMLFYKMAARQDGSGLGNVVLGKVNPGEAADGAGVNHGVVPQGPPALHQVNP